MEEEKEYQINLQHMQAQLEMAHEQRKSMDLASVKKILKDYEQLLKCYTLMRTKKEWWEGCKGMFYKGVGQESSLA